jgi:NADPH2:quinone reductase
MGARVIACASSDEKLAFARAHGADETINYAKENLREALKQHGGEHGVDVVYDPVGGPYAEPAVRSLAWQGRYLVVGFTAGEIPKIPLNLVLLKSCDIRGVFWGSWSKRDPQAQHALLSDVARWAAEGKLPAHVHAVFPLADIAAAMKLISDRKVMGKIVLQP